MALLRVEVTSSRRSFTELTSMALAVTTTSKARATPMKAAPYLILMRLNLANTAQLLLSANGRLGPKSKIMFRG